MEVFSIPGEPLPQSCCCILGSISQQQQQQQQQQQTLLSFTADIVNYRLLCTMMQKCFVEKPVKS